MTSQLPARGDRFGHYQIVRELGRGGMGTVFEATDTRTGARVALKVVLPHLTDPQSDFAERFEREARGGAAVHHPGVVQLFDVGRVAGTSFAVFELVPGGSLKDRLEKTGALPWREGAARGAEVAAALAALHAAGLVHRDVKPANVLLAADGRAKLSDLGLVKRTDSSLEPRLTATGEILGTPEYLAPELAGDRPIDARADLYALGVTLHELVAGSLPFEARGPLAFVKKHLQDAPPPLRSLVPGVPAELEALVLRLMAKDPAARGSGAKELTRELEALAKLPEPTSRSPVAIAGGVLALLALAAAGLFVARSRATPAPLANASPPPPSRSPAPGSGASPTPTPEPLWRQSALMSAIARSPKKHLELTAVLGPGFRWRQGAWPHALAWLPDRRLAMIDELGRVSVWSSDQGIPIWQQATQGSALSLHPLHPEPAPRYALAASPDGALVVAGVAPATPNRMNEVNNELLMFDAATGQSLPPFELPEGFVFGGSLAFDDAGRLLATAFEGPGLLIDARANKPVGLLDPSFKPLLDAFSVPAAEDARQGRVAFARRDTLAVLDGAAGEISSVDSSTGRVRAIVALPDGERAATAHELVPGDEGGYVRVWDLATGRPLAALGPHLATVYALTVDKAGKRLFTASQRGEEEDGEGEIRIYDLATFELLHRIAVNVRLPMLGLVLSQDEKRLLAGSIDGSLHVMSVTDDVAPHGSLLPRREDSLDAARGIPADVALARCLDSQHAVALLDNSCLVVIDFAHGSVEQRWIDLPPNSAGGLLVEPEGNSVCAIGIGGKIWRQSLSVEIPPTPVADAVPSSGLVLSPKGDMALSVSFGSDTLALWKTGKDGWTPLDTLELLPGLMSPTAATFVPDGKSILIGTYSGHVLRYTLH